MEITYMHELGNGIVLGAKITISDKIIECENSEPNPFNRSVIAIDPNINVAEYEQIAIKCYIENEVDKVTALSNGNLPQKICLEILENYIHNEWPNNRYQVLEDVNCSPYERQFVFILIPKN